MSSIVTVITDENDNPVKLTVFTDDDDLIEVLEELEKVRRFANQKTGL
jgi:hypothetical protein